MGWFDTRVRFSERLPGDWHVHTSGEGLSIECRKAFDGMETHIADCYSAIFANLDIRPNDWIALSAMTSRTNELVQSGNPIPATDDDIEIWLQILMYSHWCMVASGYALEQGEIGDAIHLHGVSAKCLGAFNGALDWFNALAENSEPDTSSVIEATAEKTAEKISASVLAVIAEKLGEYAQAPQPVRSRKKSPYRPPPVKDTLIPYVSELRKGHPQFTAGRLEREAQKRSGEPGSPFEKHIHGKPLLLKECGRTCSSSTFRQVVSAVDTGKKK